MIERVSAAPSEESGFKKVGEKANYYWSKFTWRLDVASIPFFMATGNAVGAVVGFVAYWWDSRSMKNYENKNGIAPSEGSKGLLSMFNIFDPSLARGRQRFSLAP